MSELVKEAGLRSADESRMGSSPILCILFPSSWRGRTHRICIAGRLVGLKRFHGVKLRLVEKPLEGVRGRVVSASDGDLCRLFLSRPLKGLGLNNVHLKI
jgi:hypothetical protein